MTWSQLPTFDGELAPLSTSQIRASESALNLRLPSFLWRLYRRTNGGSPEAYVFASDVLETVVNEVLPLVRTFGGLSGAVRSYERLVVELELAPRTFFPFAVDGGGDYFLTDCSTRDGEVYFLDGRGATPDERLHKLNMGLGEFFASLKTE